ncbi:hypothetical protein ACIA5C_47165 [Actinoplanes sp. NPDC051343]|uniref:hypothetical protein n=1 Tax=Actinoplanes sp. NPDC051343 TaxID=3363906 RepID=UPI0037BA9B3D
MTPALAVETAPTSPAPPRPTLAEKSAWVFYAIAALGSSIGQTWVGVDVSPWPGWMPLWASILAVAPFALVIDLGGAVAAAFADARRRLGENAYGPRIVSAVAAACAVAINIVGHFTTPYLAVMFGGLGVLAYTVWLMHSAARRRDALRAVGKLPATPPSYGLSQWVREPEVTSRAKRLALQHGYNLNDSLTKARIQLRTEERRAALARHIETMIRARHDTNPVLASIAATTTPIDDIADALMTMIDTDGWARAIAAEIQAPTPAPLPGTPGPQPEHSERESANPAEEEREDHRDEEIDAIDHAADPLTDLALMIPTNPTAYRRWREMWIKIAGRSEVTNKQLADDLNASVRTVQRIRAVGAAGLLDFSRPPRPLRLASTSGLSHP